MDDGVYLCIIHSEKGCKQMPQKALSHVYVSV